MDPPTDFLIYPIYLYGSISTEELSGFTIVKDLSQTGRDDSSDSSLIADDLEGDGPIQMTNAYISLPLFLGKLSAIFFQLLPNPLLTLDQLRLLKYNNVASGKYKTNVDIGIPSICKFDEEVEKYAFMWKERGQFSRKNNEI